MKKSTVLIVLITFVLSVVIVGIFGMKMFSYNTTIYVERITPTEVITNTGAKVEIRQGENADEYYFTLHYTEGLKVRVTFQITPADATKKEVAAEITNNNEANPVAKLEEPDLLILRSGTVRLNYLAQDGHNARATVRIFILP